MRKYYRLNNSTGLSKGPLLLHTISESTDLTTPNRPAVSTVPHESTIFLAILLAITACMMVVLGFLTVRVFQRYWIIREEERFIEEAHAAIVQAGKLLLDFAVFRVIVVCFAFTFKNVICVCVCFFSHDGHE